jgi:hypothetical protein
MDISNNKITGKISDFIQNYPWGTGANIADSSVESLGRNYALNIKNNCLETTNIQEPLLSFLHQWAEPDRQSAQNACVLPIVPSTPTAPSTS